MSDLLDENATLIYLCNNKFVIPLRETHKTYVGVGKVVAVIRSGSPVNFDDLHITLQNVLSDDNYTAVLKQQQDAEDAAQIYEALRTKYLVPCLKFIERGDNQSCKRLYAEMVTSLKKKFLGG